MTRIPLAHPDTYIPTRSRKPRTNPGPPDQVQSLTRTRNATADKAAAAVHIVRPASDNGAAARRRRAPIASASLYEPAGNRTWWWISTRCPHCGSVHLHRVRTEAEAGGRRRAGCGRVIFVVVRRTYRGYASKVAAA